MKQQNPPLPNNSQPIWEQVIQDMKSRDELGRLRYGVPLQSFNTRNAIQDAFEEALDLVVYLKQYSIERDALVTTLKEYAEIDKELSYTNSPAIQLLTKLGEW